jgi:hypothetical protein
MKTLFITFFSLCAIASLSAQNPCSSGYVATQCTFLYTYDDAGNRIERAKQVCTCEVPAPQGRATNTVSPTEKQGTLAQIISIAPNPTAQGINIQFSIAVEHAKLHIMDSNGKLIGTQIVSGTTAEADLSTYPAGIYYLSLQTETGMQTQKLVKID